MDIKRVNSSLLILILVVLWSGVSLASQLPVIDLLPNAVTTPGNIYLQDVAKITGESEIVSQLEKVNLGAAALPGSERRLTVGQIEVRLRQAGINPNDVNLIGAKEVWVQTEKQAPQTVVSSIPEQAVVANKEENSYQVVVPIRNINRHEMITADDLQIETRTGRVVPSGLATIEDLVGKRATRLLPEGVHLTTSAVEVPPVIDRGASVTILAQIGAVIVSAPGVAKDAGGLGEFISVENLTSRQVVTAQIISSELVRVEVGGAYVK